MTIKELLETVRITDNLVIIAADTDKRLFQLLRNYGRITPSMIPEDFHNKEIKGICGASVKFKIAIFV